ncbi:MULTISPECIES: hypothetical protein [Corynebacterium]|uniref:hypothetical protein n=1 Tax=Corynebacterium TaxID=1716 RepID=UPI00264895FC|nr:hypothetical protein [Corynebacterium sp.]MDN6283267.1 hypothetical protein [Corynebacterium sp.]
MLPYIVAGEVLFWCLLLGGLAVRYLLKWRAVSNVLLILTPVVDLAIIALTFVDLANGASSDFTHGLAAFYVGFSVVFGPEIIRRLDRRFARKYTDLPDNQLPTVPERTSMQYRLRCLTASTITILLLVIGIAIAGLSHSFWLIYWIIVAAFTALMWGFIGPIRDHYRARRTKRSP